VKRGALLYVHRLNSMPLVDPNDLISFSDAARDLGCGRTTLYRAAHHDELTTVEVSGRTMLVKNEAYHSFEPQWTGSRARQDDESSQ
jgi:excisionase family DNA binding protein